MYTVTVRRFPRKKEMVRPKVTYAKSMFRILITLTHTKENFVNICIFSHFLNWIRIIFNYSKICKFDSVLFLG